MKKVARWLLGVCCCWLTNAKRILEVDADSGDGDTVPEALMFNKIFGLDVEADNYITSAQASLTAKFKRRLEGNFSQYPSMFDAEGALRPHSLLHLHHMKTGGTSMDALLSCACRAESTCKLGHLDECALGSIETCFEHEKCRETTNNATLLTHCSSLYDVDRFGWGDARLVSILRHPVDRLWSLYRYESRPTGVLNRPPCFKCVPLADLYEMLDNGTLDELGDTTDVCKRSLSNYMTQFFSGRPLRGDDALAYSLQDTPPKAQKQLVLEAFFNMWNRSTLILHTDDLSDGGIRLLRALAPELMGTCEFERDNASPDVDACGETLASSPDARTRELIVKHNQLDILLYKSAMRMYALEKAVLLGE